MLILALTLLVGAASAGTARADGLPVLGVDLSRAGVAASDPVAPRYVSLPAGQDTLVAAVSQDGGHVRRSRLLDGRFSVPAVAYDGSPGGLSADGRTLVLINPRKGFPRRDTTLAVLDTRRLRARDVITLKGDFSFDAISPNGRLLYLVQYLSKRDPTRYLVRLYDLRAGRLLREPIIDPREVGDVMRGTPITRAASPDGRWAYTLYDGAGKHPFIHALDTTGRTARCIDLHGLMGLDLLFEMRLEPSPDGGTLSVVHPAYERPHAVVDLQTWEVSEPEASGQPPPLASNPTQSEDGAPAALIAGAAAFALVLLFLLLRLLRRRRPEPVEALGESGDGAPPHPGLPSEAQPGRRTLRRQPRGGARRSRTEAKP
jgi:hypothetical protein